MSRRSVVNTMAPRIEPSVSRMIQSGCFLWASRRASRMSWAVGAGWMLIVRGQSGREAQRTSGLLGSESIIATRCPRAVMPRANSSAAVVFPAPPLGLTKATAGNRRPLTGRLELGLRP
jgi:hypothetical protein